MMKLLVWRDQGDIFKGLIIGFFPTRLSAKVLEGVMIPVPPNDPETEKKSVMSVQHLVKRLKFQSRPA
ncbi:hypothetical protein P3S68_000463 [Capsicum galapagoense]